MRYNTQVSLLLVVSVGLVITTLSLTSINYQLRKQLDTIPTCQQLGYKGFDIAVYNVKTDIISIRCSNNLSTEIKLRSSYPLPTPKKRVSSVI